MGYPQIIKGSLIRGLYTKFYYLNNSLHYQIVVNYEGNGILYRDFALYDDYRKCHDLLIGALNKGDEISLHFMRAS